MDVYRWGPVICFQERKKRKDKLTANEGEKKIREKVKKKRLNFNNASSSRKK